MLVSVTLVEYAWCIADIISEGNIKKSMSYTKRQKQVRKEHIILWMFFGVIALGAIIGLLNSINNKVKAVPLDSSVIFDEVIPFDADPNVAQAVEDNYVRYLHMAYVLIGEYPDCEYYKISANVSRNDYNWAEDFYVDDGKLYYNYYKDGKALGKPGIDVSEFQHDIDWDKVKATGMQVVMIRLGYRGYGSEGKIHLDSAFEKNLDAANKVGMETGVYFFSSAINKEEGIEEAEFCLKHLKEKKIKLPVVIDTEYVFEEENARANNISVEDRTAAVVGFCETIEAAGYTPMIYASRDQFIKYLDIDQIGNWQFWLASYDTPEFPYHTEGYQYSPYGLVDGIETQVDLNVWMK
ncbi:MAG TPA: Lyzozyme M1 (1,4-beta-N-acetylmuramidase) [Lachnospiraceae bacterium]|nr:Lyzozyme M1 (1,4-beta-N-acetylmuramidase) [Lachnospiraceae bacterium]